MARAGQKSEGFKVNVTMEQKLRWEEAARERDMTMSQMIREAVEMYIAVMKRQKELDKKQNIRQRNELSAYFLMWSNIVVNNRITERKQVLLAIFCTYNVA